MLPGLDAPLRVAPRPPSGSLAVDPRSLAAHTRCAGVRRRLAARRRRPDTHRTCPGHAVTIDQEWIYPTDVHECTNECPEDCPDEDDSGPTRAHVLVPVCEGWDRHGHRARYGSSSAPKRKTADMTEEEHAEAKAARALLLRLNRDWPTAGAVRLEWLTKFLTRKTLPANAGTFLARALIEHPHLLSYHRAADHLPAMLGITGESWAGRGKVKEQIAKASDKRAAVLALAAVLSACEGQATREDWRTPNSTTAHYLRTLAEWGHELVEVEARAAGTWTETPEDATEPEEKNTEEIDPEDDALSA